MRGKYSLYYDWIMEVGEERLVEQKFLKENFYSREDYMVFLFILMRFSKKLASEIRDSTCLLYTSPSPRDLSTSRMPSSA